MNIKDTKLVLKTFIEKKVPVTPMLWAQHGIGKSSAVSQLAKDMGYKLYSILLSQKEAVDVAGVLYTFVDAELGMSVTASHPPQWFADALKKGKVILFLDEFNMARREVLNAAFELVLDRKLNNMKLPDDVFVVCAGNPEDERYDVTPLSESLRDRLMHLQVTPDVDAWLAWAKESNAIHPDVIKFIEVAPKAAFHADAKDEKFPVDIKHSFRSWERAGIVHALDLPAGVKAECIRGIVGADLAAAFIRTLQLDNAPIDAKDIVTGADSVKVKVEKFSAPAGMRIDLLASTVEGLVTYLTKNKLSDASQVNNVIRFIEQLPDDVAMLAITGIHELPQWAERLMKDKAMRTKLQRINDATKLTQEKKGA